MNANNTKQAWIIGWLVAFLGFPIGGFFASMLIGRMDTAVDGVLGGAIAGAFIGAAQFVALRQRLPISWRWIAITSAGLALGVGLSATLFGTEMTPEAILLRAPLTGLLVGGAQWFVLWQFVRRAYVWIPALALIYGAAWYVTSLVIGASTNVGFYVFGALGALLNQALTELVLWRLLRVSVEVRSGLSTLHYGLDSKARV
jgi:hypothetical protein